MFGTEASATEGAHAELSAEGDTLVVVLAGEWSLEQTQPRFETLTDRDASGAASARSLSFDATALGAWDTSLLIFLLQCEDYCAAHDLACNRSGLPERASRLLTLATAVPERVQAEEPVRASFIARLGSTALGAWHDVLAAITFTGDVALSFARLFTRRNHMRWREFWVVVQTNSSRALPIVTLIALLDRIHVS